MGEAMPPPEAKGRELPKELFEPPLEIPDLKGLHDKALAAVKASAKSLERFEDKYAKNWNDSLLPPENVPSRFSPGDEVEINGGDKLRVNLRNANSGQVERSVQSGTRVKISGPSLDRKTVVGTLFVKVRDPDGNMFFVADRLLQKPSQPPIQKEQKPSPERTQPPKPEIQPVPKEPLKMPEARKPEPKPPEQIRPLETPKTLHEYLVSYPEFERHYNALKGNLEAALKNLVSQSKGTAIEGSVEALYKGFSTKFDDAMLKVFETANLTKNPEIIKRLMQKAPLRLEIKLAELPPGVAGRADIMQKPPPLLLNKDFQGNYGDFKETLIHELTHLYLEDLGVYNRNPRLNEGITEALASGAEEGHHGAEAYGAESSLASALLRLNSNAVMDWYTGGSDEKFKNALRADLAALLGEKKANLFTNYISYLPTRDRVIKESTANELVTAIKSKLPNLSERDSAAVTLASNEFMNRHFDYTEWGARVKGITGYDFANTEVDTVTKILDGKTTAEKKMEASLMRMAREIEDALKTQARV